MFNESQFSWNVFDNCEKSSFPHCSFPNIFFAFEFLKLFFAHNDHVIFSFFV